MGKLFRAVVLFAAMGALVSAGGLVTSAPAQDKKDKDTKKDKDKDKKEVKKADEIGMIEVYQAKDGWRFRVKNTEGKSVAIGTVGFETKEEALKTIEFVKATLAKAKVEVLKDEKDKK
jgi:uncharacterized protein YegP (UPF0339 family)